MESRTVNIWRFGEPAVICVEVIALYSGKKPANMVEFREQTALRVSAQVFLIDAGLTASGNRVQYAYTPNGIVGVIIIVGSDLMKQCMDAENLHRRLKKIIGQVQAIDRMIDEDIPCEEILSQINAAKSALHKCGQVVLEGHIRHCVRDGIEHGDADKTIDNFTKAVERFSNLG